MEATETLDQSVLDRSSAAGSAHERANEQAVESGGLFAPRFRALSVGTVALISMLAFEALAVAAAMPAVAEALDGLALYALAFGGALATSMIGMVFAGQDADRHGPYRSMWIGLLLFGGGLVVAGFAPDMAWMVVGRIGQGLGSGMLGVAIYVSMGRLIPGTLHPRLFALFAAAWVVPAIVGPGLAGLMVETLGWRSVFLLVAILLLPCAWMVLPQIASLPPPRGTTEERPATSNRSGLLWAVLAALGALALHQLGQTRTTAALPATLVASLVVLLAASRLLPTGTLRAARGLPSVIMLRGLLAAAFFCAEVFIPLWLNSERGWSVAQAGLALSAGALCWSIGSAIQARMDDAARRTRWLRRGLLMVGVAIASIAAIVLGDAHATWVIAPWMLAGLGIGISFPMLSVLTLQLSAEHEKGANSSALQLSDALTTACVMSLAGTFFAALHAAHPSLAFAVLFGLAAALALTGAALASRCQ